MEQVQSDQNQKMKRGASIIAKNWLHLRMKQKVLIVSSEKTCCRNPDFKKKPSWNYSLQVDLMLLEEKGKK